MSTSETPIYDQLRKLAESGITDFETLAKLEGTLWKSLHDTEKELTAAKAEVEGLTRDIETGFMKGAYARLKELQVAEQRRDAWKKMVFDLIKKLHLSNNSMLISEAQAAHEKLLKEDGG